VHLYELCGYRPVAGALSPGRPVQRRLEAGCAAVTAQLAPAKPPRTICSPGRATIGRCGRTDRRWAYPLTTFTVLLAFVACAAYAAIANRDYYAAPYLSPF
jgi:hypothetical protein